MRVAVNEAKRALKRRGRRVEVESLAARLGAPSGRTANGRIRKAHRSGFMGTPAFTFE